MEIKINIPKNDYIQPVEVREEVVQHICEAFLNGGDLWGIFHPYSGGYNRPSKKFIIFNGRCHEFSTHGERFNGAEMSAAFKALIKAGYHIFRVYEYGAWLGYKCSKKPFEYGGTEVISFTK